MRHPSEHSHFAWEILKPQSFTGNPSFQNTKDHFGLVLLEGEKGVREFSVNGSASDAVGPPYFGPCSASTLRPYNSLDCVIVFKFTTALGADRLIAGNHRAHLNLS